MGTGSSTGRGTGTDPVGGLGVLLIGARGAVATSAMVGACALARGLREPVGCVSAVPPLADLPLARFGDLHFGGLDIRAGNLVEEAAALAREGVVPPDVAQGVAEELVQIDARIQPGHLYRSGSTIEGLATPGWARRDVGPVEIRAQLQEALAQLQEETGAARVVVVNLASTEPLPPEGSGAILEDLPRLQEAMDSREPGPPLPLSAIYAYAALEAGAPYVNFTPSAGATSPALQAFACQRGVPHAGRDGKTGETLVKSVLAPMLLARNLRILAWRGYNLLGNRDGEVLADPASRAAKLEGKVASLRDLGAGGDLVNEVSIDFVPSLGDWKTAWDFVHFEGFLGVKMGLEFTWRGCDSALAAPLVLDLIRLVDLSARRGESGALGHLACFFKSPLGSDQHTFAGQMHALHEYARRTSGGPATP